MQRRWRGSFYAFWATAWLVLRRPSLLAREMPARLPRRDGRRFARVALFITAAVGTGLLGVAFGLTVIGLYAIKKITTVKV